MRVTDCVGVPTNLLISVQMVLTCLFVLVRVLQLLTVVLCLRRLTTVWAMDCGGRV